MKLFKHLASQPFIVATGIAALVHSTWSIATYFSGPEPNDGQFLHWLAWGAVAFLVAFSMDIGQIVTSAEIREGKRTRTKYLTFGLFAVATFYCQFLYISSHMPVVPLAPGVRPELASFIQWTRDLAVFILPALLPASTLLYTFSHEKPGVESTPSNTHQKATPSFESEKQVSEVVDDEGGSLVVQTDTKASPTAEELQRWRKMWGPESEVSGPANSPLLDSPNGHGESQTIQE
jgi:hypothetical protein